MSDYSYNKLIDMYYKSCYNRIIKGGLLMDKQKLIEKIKSEIPNYLPIDDTLISNLAVSIIGLTTMNDKLLKNIDMLSRDRLFMSGRSKFVNEVESGFKLLGVTPSQRKKFMAEVEDELDGIL